MYSSWSSSHSALQVEETMIEIVGFGMRNISSCVGKNSDSIDSNNHLDYCNIHINHDFLPSDNTLPHFKRFETWHPFNFFVPIPPNIFQHPRAVEYFTEIFKKYILYPRCKALSE
jgi:hypothetical protein